MAGRRLILDSGALSALAEGEPRALAWAFRSTQRGLLLGIPAPVLAETLTGQPRDAQVHRVIPSCKTVLDTTADIAAGAGVLRYRAARSDLTIDAIVMATAVKYPGSILLTGDADDMNVLLAHTDDARLAVRSVNAATAG
jgi:predicted nucleic acid-binding protein